MFTSSEEVLRFIKDEAIEFVDVRFTDLPGQQQHFNVPAAGLTEDFFSEGVMFDGSSIRGFAEIHKSDMKLIPDPATAFLDPFRAAKTLNMNFSIVEPRTGEPYERDPRQVAAKAEAYLKSTGIADTVYFGPEAEFYVFDAVRFQTSQNEGFYHIDSIEGAWNTGRVDEGGNRGYKPRYKGGYFPVPPMDHFADLRDQMTAAMIAAGIGIERAHHEVGTAGQADQPQVQHPHPRSRRGAEVRYIVKNVAWANGKTATFMPKPPSANGSGMHCHQSLWNAVRRCTRDELGYAGLSDCSALHRRPVVPRAVAARVHEPTVNSYPDVRLGP
jgi:glutamine synthetase